MVGVFTYYCNDEATLTDIENSAQSKPDVLFTSKGDKVIKVCSESGFTSDKGNLVASEQGSLYNVKITGMTCFRCVNAISNVVKDLPILAFTINLDKASGTFILSEGIDINMIVSIINSIGSKFTATL